jgi:hypothetical protein
LNRYEAENQSMLQVYEAESCDVVRNSKGQVISAAVMYPDGRSEVVYDCLSSAREPGPVFVSSSRRLGRNSYGWPVETPGSV